MNTTVRTKSPRASEDLELNLGKVYSLDVESGQ